VIQPLAEDLIQLYDVPQPESEGELVCASSRGTSVHLDNWRNRVSNPAAAAAGVEWGTPDTGRRTFISLQIHAGVSPVLVAAGVGHTTGETIWRHYSREFDRARTTEVVPMEAAIRAARRRIATSRGPKVDPGSNVGPLRAIR
jgi:integrase